jgi:hypothetical protein
MGKKRMKLYVVVENITDDWEVENSIHHFFHRSNAVNFLADRKNQDYAPIAKENGYEVAKSTETRYSAGYEGNYSKGSIEAWIEETEVADFTL